MNDIFKIDEAIQHLQPAFKASEKRLGVFKDVIKERFEQQQLPRFEHNGLIVQYKKHTQWEWRPSFYDLLEEEGKLPLAVSIPKALEEAFYLEPFKISGGTYIHFYPKRQSKEESNREKAYLSSFREELSTLTLDALCSLYQAQRVHFDLLKQKYEKQKETFVSWMNENGKTNVRGESGLFKIRKKQDTYDIDAIFECGVEHVEDGLVSGTEFFRSCPISSTKVEEMADKGWMTSKTIEEHRYPRDEENVEFRIEIISADALAERKLLFMKKRITRGQHFKDYLEEKKQMEQLLQEGNL